MRKIENVGKGAKILPNRAALNDITSGRKSITDYSKKVSEIERQPTPLVTQLIAKR